MAQTILDKCLDELQARLAVLALTDRSDGMGAETIVAVTRDPEGITELANAMPFIVIECDDQESGNYLNIAQQDWHKPVKVTLVHSRMRTGNAENLPQDFAEFLKADLIRGILTNTSGSRDITLGGNAIMVTCKAAKTFSTILTEPHVAAQVLIDIWYRTNINNPYATV